MSLGETYSLEDCWSDVDRRVRAKYGDAAETILRHLRGKEAARAGAANLMVHEIGRGKDLFQRNLRTLEWIGKSNTGADPAAVKQLYTDALADLQSIYPQGVKGDGTDFFEVWKHVLDAARDDAQKKAGE